MVIFDSSASAERFAGKTAQENVEYVITTCRGVVPPSKLNLLAFYVMDDGSGNRYVAVLLYLTNFFGMSSVDSFMVLDAPFLSENEIKEVDKLLDFAGTLETPVIYYKTRVHSTQLETVEDASHKLADYIKDDPAYHLDKNSFKALLRR